MRSSQRQKSRKKHWTKVCNAYPSIMLQSLVVALVLSRPDYGNATFAGLQTCLLNHLQSVLNAAARSIIIIVVRNIYSLLL